MNVPSFKPHPLFRRKTPLQQASVPGARGGFSLVEVMVASAISLILVGLLLTAARTIMASYRETEGSVVRQGDVGFAIDQIIQDIEAMVIPNVGGAEALRAFPEEVGDLKIKSQWLTLLSTTVDTDNSETTAPLPAENRNFTGATRAVSYRLGFQNPIDGKAEQPIYAIYRSVASAQHTFDNAVGLADLQADYWSKPEPNPAPTPYAPLSVECYLAGNIAGFQVRFKRADDGKWTKTDDDVRIGRDGMTVNGTPVEGGFVGCEVSLTVLTADGALRVMERTMPLQDAIRRYGKTSVRQVAFF